VFLGIGISSPVVVGQWHGAEYGTRAIAQTREYVALVRECLSGETVTFQGDFYDVKRFRLGVRLGERVPKIAIGALNPKMLETAGAIADAVLLNYLPASHIPWSVEQVRKGGDATIYAYIHCAVTDRDRYVDTARKDLFSYAVVDAYANNFSRAGFGDDIDALRAARAAKDREGSVAAISDAMVDAIQIMGSADHVANAVAEYVDNGVEVPIVFPCPWGDDRRATVETTMEAAIATISSR
jgi:alkanesulfonate monooxygenase SsuD/methylene tetrahydromethanopterin reductase-like flavin-dependent oxidoreductase (luciferase family)